MRKGVLAVFIVALFAVSAQAGPTLFSDNFDTENGGLEALDYAGFANWTVSDGTVDLIGNGGTYDFQPGHGLYVDMDGSTQDAGKMLTSSSLDLAPGTYVLSFDLAGNQRSGSADSVTVQVNMGSVFSKEYTLAKDEPFQTFTETIVVDTPTMASLSFEGAGGDNVGMLLDNVSVAAIPAPGAVLLGSLGAGLVGWLRRRTSL